MHLTDSPNRIATPFNTRGMIELLDAVNGNPAKTAAYELFHTTKEIIICTGFPVNGHPETDGPPGAVLLTNSLVKTGKNISIVSWNDVLELMKPALPNTNLIEINKQSSTIDNHSSIDLSNSLLMTIEICSSTKNGAYLNMKGADISKHTPHFEKVFGDNANISVGDGGNEYGMGSAPVAFFKKWNVERPVTYTDILVPCSVSNYGCYAIAAELSIFAKMNLLDSPDSHSDLIAAMVNQGAVCGFTGKNILQVDGQPLSETTEILEKLHIWVNNILDI